MQPTPIPGFSEPIWRDSDPNVRSALTATGVRHYFTGECWCREEWSEEDGFRGLAHSGDPRIFVPMECVGPHSEGVPAHTCGPAPF